MGEKLGVAEVAEIYDVTKRTIYNRLKSGELPAEKVKNEKGVEVWQIDRDDVIDPAIYNEVFRLDNIDVQIEKEILLKDLKETMQEEHSEYIKEFKDFIEKQTEQYRKDNQELVKKIGEFEELKNRIAEIDKSLSWLSISFIFTLMNLVLLFFIILRIFI